MDIEKYMQFINYIENKYNVDKWTVEDTHIWPLIRIKLGLYISYYNQNKLTKKENKVDVDKEKIKFDEIKSTIIDKWININYDAVFLTHTGVKTKINGIWYDRFCDQLVKQLADENNECLLLEYTTSDRYRDKNSIESYRITEEATYYLKQHYNDEEYSDFYCSLDNYDMFLKETFEFLNSIKCEMPEITSEWLVNEYKQIRIIADYFKLIFANATPNIGFVVCYYTNLGFSFNLACKEMNIVSVDLQHGLISKYHFSYASWNKIPHGGYELLPQVFWCWSEEEQNLIKKWNCDNNYYHKVLNGGNTWLALWKNVKNTIDINFKLITDKIDDKNYKKILYTQSSNIDEFVFEAIENSPDNWIWLIRFHPLIPKENRNLFIDKLKRLTNKNLEWEIDDIPLFALIQNTDINVTSNSSTVVESQYFGKKSIVTTKVGEQYYKSLIDKGLVKAAYNSNELLDFIKLLLDCETVNIKNEDMNNKVKLALKEIQDCIGYNYTVSSSTQKDINNLIYYSYENSILKCIEYNKYIEILKYYNDINYEDEFDAIINKALKHSTLNAQILKKSILSEEAVIVLCSFSDSKVKKIFCKLMYNEIISLKESLDFANKLTELINKFQSIRLLKCILFEVIKYVIKEFSDYEEQYYHIFEHYIKVSCEYIEYVYNIANIFDNLSKIFDNETQFIIYMYLYKNNRINYNELISALETTLPYMKKFLVNKTHKINGV